MKCEFLTQASRDGIRSFASHLEGNVIRVLAKWILIVSSLRKIGYIPAPHRLLNRFNRDGGQCTGLVTLVAINDRQTPLKLSVAG
jgi:hypothetical protein